MYTGKLGAPESRLAAFQLAGIAALLEGIGERAWVLGRRVVLFAEAARKTIWRL